MYLKPKCAVSKKKTMAEEINEISNFRNESVQKSTCTTFLDNFKVSNKFQYTWTIENNFCDKIGENIITSPIITLRDFTGDEYYWSIQLKQNEISLWLEICTDNEISVGYKFTLLCTGTKVQTKHQSYTFHTNNRSQKSWFQDQLIKGTNGKKDQYLPFTLLESKTIIILLEGEFTVRTITKELTKKDAIQDILHFLYTSTDRVTLLKLTKGLSLFRNNLNKQFEDELFSELNIENAAEIYKFFYSLRKTELKNKVMEFIKKNNTAVIATKGWKSLVKSSDVDMITEMFSAFANNDTTNNDVPENIEVLTNETPMNKSNNSNGY